MKHIVISLPAMGKTTLVKKARDLNWSNGKGVDFDLKGLNCYSTALSVSCTSMCNDMFQEGKKFITAFNGCIDFNVLDQDAIVYFVAPADTSAMNATLLRAYRRGDSPQFVEEYYSHIREWADDLYKSYERALSVLGESRCHFVGIVGHKHTLTDVFTITEDGDLVFTGYDHYVHGNILFPKFSHHIRAGILDSEIVNPVEQQISRFVSHLDGAEQLRWFGLSKAERAEYVRKLPFIEVAEHETHERGIFYHFKFYTNKQDMQAGYACLMNCFLEDFDPRGNYDWQEQIVSQSVTEDMMAISFRRTHLEWVSDEPKVEWETLNHTICLLSF
jgi:hypothetical protein